MKKILAIVTMAAMVAGAFAADVAAKVKLTGSLFDYVSNVGPDANGAPQFNGIKAMTLNPHQSHNWEPDMQLSYGDDVSGATIKFKTLNEWGSGEGETSTAWNIWFKPLDILKINIGDADIALNAETIDWSKITGVAGAGYGLEINTNGIFFGTYLDMGHGTWMVKPENGDATMANVGIKFAYSADFGSIGVLAGLKKDALKVGAGYSGSAGAISYFADAVFEIDAKKLSADAFVAYSDAVTVKLYLQPNFNFNEGADTFAGLGYKFRVDASVGGLGVYFKSTSGNVLDKNLVFKPGVTGSVGACGWEAALNIDLTFAEKTVTKVSVPVEFTVNF